MKKILESEMERQFGTFKKELNDRTQKLENTTIQNEEDKEWISIHQSINTYIHNI